MWFAKRVAHLTTVEHDPKWASTVKDGLRAADLETRVSYHLCPPGADQKSMSEYVRVVDKLKEGSLDFCLVDGIVRDRCALLAVLKIRPGGILILDNVNWYIPRDPKSPAPNSRGVGDDFASERWETFTGYVKNWRCVWTTNGIWDTAFWVRPPEA